jgi:hypothetical protein
VHAVEDDDARSLASLASQILGIQRPQAERLAEAYVRENPGSGWERFLRWIETAPPIRSARETARGDALPSREPAP